MARHTESVVLKKVYVEEDGRRLPVVPSHVDRLAASIKEIGLLEPIIVCRRTKRTPTLILVAGRHRLEACKKLRHNTISAVVESEDSPEIERWRALAEIDENLIRRDITTTQRTRLIAKRKKAYEEVHPETKHGGAQGKAGGGKKAKGAKSASFADDTATKTGRSKRSIEADATRAKKLGPDLDRIDGTSLDKGVELDALANMPPDERKPLIDRAVAGETVSAVAAKTAKASAAIIEAVKLDPDANQRDAAKRLGVTLGMYQRTRRAYLDTIPDPPDEDGDSVDQMDHDNIDPENYLSAALIRCDQASQMARDIRKLWGFKKIKQSKRKDVIEFVQLVANEWNETAKLLAKDGQQ